MRTVEKVLTVSHAAPALRRHFLELDYLRYSYEVAFTEAPCPGLESTYQARGLAVMAACALIPSGVRYLVLCRCNGL